jgi:hypothetical protein
MKTPHEFLNLVVGIFFHLTQVHYSNVILYRECLFSSIIASMILAGFNIHFQRYFCTLYVTIDSQHIALDSWKLKKTHT